MVLCNMIEGFFRDLILWMLCEMLSIIHKPLILIKWKRLKTQWDFYKNIHLLALELLSLEFEGVNKGLNLQIIY